MRIVFSTTVGAQFAELLVQQLGYREPPTMSGADEVARLQSEVARLQEDTAAKDAAMEKAGQAGPGMARRGPFLGV